MLSKLVDEGGLRHCWLQLVAWGIQATLLHISMSAQPAALLVLLLSCSVESTADQDGAELAATALHSRLAKYDRNFRPGYGGPPLEVGVGLLQLAVVNDDEVRIQLDVTWQDLRLAHEVEGVKEIRWSTKYLCFKLNLQACW